VLYRLKKANYDAYLVGGGVRDILLGKQPKDFDIATNASPEQLRDLFRNSRIIGRRFRLVHVRFGRDIIEVATFRSGHTDTDDDTLARVADGLIVRDNVYGTLEEDAWRRDFTINALYYNIDDFSLVDYTGGLPDLETRTLRMIGDPVVRLQEDPVRMLRAVRLAAKLDFNIEPQLEEQILAQGERLELVPSARLYDEVIKLFFSGHGQHTLILLEQYRLLQYLFTLTSSCLSKDDYPEKFIQIAVRNTDRRIADDLPVTPAFLFAAMLWPAVQEQSRALEKVGHSPLQALNIAGGEALQVHHTPVAIPKRFRLVMKEIWGFQNRLEQPKGKRALKLVEHPRFRAAYDFLLLRNEAGEPLDELCKWWTEFQQASREVQHEMCRTLGGGSGRKRRRSRSGKKSSPNKSE